MMMGAAASLVFLVRAGECPGGEPPTLAWSDVEKLVELHPALAIWKAKTKIKQGQKKAVEQYPNPEAEAFLGQSKAHSGSEDALIGGVELSIPLEWVLKRLYAARAAEAAAGASALEAESAGLDVTKDLRILFLRIAHDQARASLEEDFMDELSRFVSVVKVRVDAGEAALVELQRIEVEAEEAEIEAHETRTLASVHMKQLSLQLGGKVPDSFVVDFDLEAPTHLPDPDEAAATLESANPKIKAAAKNLEAAGYAVKAEKQQAFPKVEIGGFYEHELDVKSYGAAVKISVPLWNWNKGAVAKAEAEKQLAAVEMQGSIVELKSLLLDAHTLALQKQEAALEYRESVLPKARQSAETLEKMYKSGDAKLMDVLDARRSLLEAERKYLWILFEHHAAAAVLTSLTTEGTP